MPLAPSTRISVHEVLSTARELTKTVDQKRVLIEQGRSFYRLALSEIVTMLNGAANPAYKVEEAVVFTPALSGSVKYYTFDLATLVNLFDMEDALENSAFGACIHVPDTSEFISHKRTATGLSSRSYDDDIIFNVRGSQLRIIAGSKVIGAGATWTGSIFSFTHYRQPNYPTTDAQFTDGTTKIDLPDKYAPLLVKRIYTYCILQTENDVPRNLANEMQLDYSQISAAASAEIASRMKREVETARSR